MWTRRDLKEDSKGLLKLNYWPFVLVGFIYSLVAGGGGGGSASSAGNSLNNENIEWSDPDFLATLLAVLAVVLVIFVVLFVIGVLLKVFFLNPIKVGCYRYMVMARDVKPVISEIMFSFKGGYLNVVKTMFLMDLYQSLWSLLFIIPGVVKGYEYRMIPYLLSENPYIDSKQAFAISKNMMTGNKMDTFVLDLSMIGWGLLSLCTCGLLSIFFVTPYKMLIDACLYLRLSGRYPVYKFAPGQASLQ